jgi:hypothetical protein
MAMRPMGVSGCDHPVERRVCGFAAARRSSIEGAHRRAVPRAGSRPVPPRSHHRDGSRTQRKDRRPRML